MADIYKEYIMYAIGMGIVVILVFVLGANFEVVRSAATNDSTYNQLSAVNPLSTVDTSDTAGSQVIGTIRYYANYDDVTVTVDHYGLTHSYTTTTYDSGVFSINPSASYTAIITYEAKALKGVSFTLQ